MSAPAEEYAFDFKVAEEAARRWRRQRGAREHKLEAVAAGHYHEAESAERLTARVNHLVAQVRETALHEGHAVPRELGELASRAPMESREVDDALFERVIGETRDFLSTDFLSGGVRVSRAVARIVTKLDGGRVSYGTGFLVSPSLLLTNHHVLTSREDAARSTAEFDYALEDGNPLTRQIFELQPDRFFLNHKPLDYALVAVAPKSAAGKPLSTYGCCWLIGREGKISLGESANIIQHPKGEMRQVVVRENALVDLRNKPDDDPKIENFLFYNGDTEPGSSGSAVFNDQWEVVGLHHSGVPDTDGQGNWLDLDGRIWRKGQDPARIKWVANEGVRISRLLAHVAAAKIDEPQRALWIEFLEGGGEAPQPTPAPGPTPYAGHQEVRRISPPDMADSGGEVVIELPGAVITVRCSGTSSRSTGYGPATVNGPGLEALRLDPDYGSRPGFDPAFCGFQAPLPRPDGALRRRALDVARAGHTELRYHHFSVVMHAERRLAIVSAVNCWTRSPHRFQREGGDRWAFDPRIDEAAQAGEALYSRNPYDRGHLARRADAAWGESAKEAELANNDTFHWTNCAPQHEIFNQSGKASKAGLRLWGDLENLVAEQAAETEGRLSVFNGPIFQSDDIRYRGVLIPREYWKVIAFHSPEAGPRVLAFVLSQADLIAELREEFEVGEFRPFQLQLTKLESRTDLDFGDLWKHDPLQADGAESFFTGETSLVPIRGARDLVL